jgi:biopolymer transport protein ExbD
MVHALRSSHALVPSRAGVVRYRAALRKAIRRNASAPGVDFLNVTAMLDLMTILLVFLLKSMTASAAALPPHPELSLPTSLTVRGPSEDGVVVVVSRSQILVGDDPEPVVRLPGREQLAQSGVDARYKQDGAGDLYIVPLGNALAQARRLDKALQRARGESAETSSAVVVADASTPYRLMIEVLYTLGQSEFGTQHLMVRSGRKR